MKSDPATKADIELAVSELRSEMGEMRSEVGELRSEMGEIRSDVNGLRSDVNGLRSDVNGLRSGMDELRSGMDELRSGVASLGQRIEDQGKTLSAELARHSSAVRNEVRTWFVVLDDKHTAQNDAVRTGQQELREDFDDHRADATVHRLPRKPRTG